MITITRNVPARKILQFQELVKQHDLRFSAFILREIEVSRGKKEYQYLVTIYTPNDSAYENMNAFGSDWVRMNTEIVEKVRPIKFWRKVQKLFGG